MKKIIISLIISLLLLNNTYSNENIGKLADNWFSKFSHKIEIKFSDEKEKIYFKSFSNKLDNLLYKRKFNVVQTNLINDLIKLSNEKVFNLEKKEKENKYRIKLKTNSLINGFKNISYNKENIFLENGVWYSYNFTNFLSFPKGVKPTSADLKHNGIYKNSTLVFLKDDNTLGFTNKYTKTKLVSNSIIYGISGKYNFLKEIKNDKKKLNYETDIILRNIKKKAISLTKGKNRQEKIKILYNYVLDNIEYTNSFSLNDYKIYSGLDTYENKDGVCEGYTKLFLYMLNFSNIDNVEVIRGFVIDAQDFPKVGHAWTKIGDYYYDPTFDDPIGAKKTKEFNNYKYFKLPKDIFYLNRFDFEKTPEYLKKKDLNYRKTFILKRTQNILDKYKNSGYKVLELALLKDKYNIQLDKELDINDLSKIIKLYKVKDFTFKEGNKTRKIKGFNYFPLKDIDIESLIEQINYNFNGYYLFDWELENGTHEYRLAYNVKF